MHSAPGADTCTPCAVGHYCDTNTTTTTDMFSNRRCPAGLLCPPALAKTPEFTNEACPAGFFCEEAVSSPEEWCAAVL